MPQDYDTYMADLSGLQTAPPVNPSAPARVVRSADGTQYEHPRAFPIGAEQYAGVDALFGDKVAYQRIKSERPEHRLMLWHRLNGHTVTETANALGFSISCVQTVCRQPWFREAFCRLSTEMGKDAYQTFLKGEVLPAMTRLVHLAEKGETDQVKLAANREILDRFLGKPVAKTELSVSGSMETVMVDASRLMDENARIQRELAARGIGQHQPN